MPLPTEITVTQLSRLVGLPQAPRIVDVRVQSEFNADPRLIPGATHIATDAVLVWATASPAERFIVVCGDGAALSQGVAALLRHQGLAAETLEGGFSAWRHAGQPLVTTTKLPRRDHLHRTVWVMRARPKIDRIACPWLIRRFVDPDAVILFVAAAEVPAVAARFDATPFDIEGVFFSQRGEACSFDTMLDAFGLDVAAQPCCEHRARGRYRAPRRGAASGRAARHLARAIAHVTGRYRAAGGGDDDLRRPLSLGAGCERRDA